MRSARRLDYRVFQKRALQLSKLIYIYSEDIHRALNCHNVANYSKFYLGQLRFNATSTGNAGCLKIELHNGIPNIAVWRALRKSLHLKVYKLSIIQDVERWRVCTSLSMNVFVVLATQ
jgi:hypothetical protein